MVSRTCSLQPKEVDFSEVWQSLKPSVLEIIKMHPISMITWNHTFSDVYDLCVAVPNSLSETLYNELKKCISGHVQDQYEHIKNYNPQELLQEYFRMWKIYYEGTKYVHSLFGYLNKQYVKQKRNSSAEGFAHFAAFLQMDNVKEVGCMALEIWREELVTKIQGTLVSLLLKAIADDREGNIPQNSEIVAGVIASFVQMEDSEFEPAEYTKYHGKFPPRQRTKEPSSAFYQKTFEQAFLHATEMHYTALAQKLLAELTCSEYMEAVIEILEAEEKRSKTYVHTSSLKKVTELCQEVMIKVHREKLHAVCHGLITDEKTKDLRNMYRLLKPIQAGLTCMVKEFESYVKLKGLESIANLSGDNVPQQFVENILKVYTKFNDMKTTVFMEDSEFSSGLDKALQGVVNSKEPGSSVPKASERLSKYTDSLLRKTSKGISDADLDSKLTNAIIIFRYIEDKDIFQKCYSKMLAGRLINSLSVSMDAEEMMINKLKQACGYEFTSKLSRMFTDIGLSTELSIAYEAHVQSTEHKNRHVSVQTFILQAGSWPLSHPQHSSSASGSNTNVQSQESINFILPRVLQPCIEDFEKYYTQKHNGRKLSWLYNMSHGDVRLNYLDKSYIVTMNVHQIAVLVCFENTDNMKLSDVGLAVGLTGEVLLKTVKTLVDNALLNVDGTLNHQSDLKLNLSMTSRRIKFRLPSAQISKQVEKEAEAVSNTVSQDRKYYMECAIVRIMKTRKVLKHNALVAEVMEQTKARFTPDIPFIKKSIEDLIEKMYIQRTDQNDEYQYLA